MVGKPVGAVVGLDDGCGVVFPGRYVGSNVGSAVGEKEGSKVGGGVALPVK